MTKTIPCSGCGTPVSIPAKYARATRATCFECAEAQITSHPYGKKFSEVFYAGWYADHLKDLEQAAFDREVELWKKDLGLKKKPRNFLEFLRNQFLP